MSNINRAKKRELCLDDMPITTVKKKVKIKKFDPAKKLRDPNFVTQAFFLALQDNDIDAAIDIMDGYLMAYASA